MSSITTFKESARAELDFPGQLAKGRRDTGGAREVHRVQEWLTFNRSQTTIDGDFGAATEAAVMNFQRRRAIRDTGVVDEQTWSALTVPMHAALEPVTVSAGDTLPDVLLQVARAHLEVGSTEFTIRSKENCGPWVRLYMHGEEGTNQPWCAGFVSYVIAQAADAMHQEQPIPRQVSVDALVTDAKNAGRFLAATALTDTTRAAQVPRGTLFVKRAAVSDWTHVGIVTSVGAEVFGTIEGNTTGEDGGGVWARVRRFSDEMDFVLLLTPRGAA